MGLWLSWNGKPQVFGIFIASQHLTTKTMDWEHQPVSRGENAGASCKTCRENLYISYTYMNLWSICLYTLTLCMCPPDELYFDACHMILYAWVCNCNYEWIIIMSGSFALVSWASMSKCQKLRCFSQLDTQKHLTITTDLGIPMVIDSCWGRLKLPTLEVAQKPNGQPRLSSSRRRRRCYLLSISKRWFG